MFGRRPSRWALAHILVFHLLLRPKERWRSIVMSKSVCLSVRQDISGITLAIFTNFSVHVAYGRGSVLLRQGDEIRRERGSFGGFLPQ